MRSQAWSRATAEGITPTQGDILALLHSRTAALRLSDIALELAITPATASDAVSTLVTKGLVEKVRASQDRRALALSLTRKGVELASSVSASENFLAQVLQSLDGEDKLALLGLIVKVIRSMQDRGDIPATRMCLTCDYYAANPDKDPDRPHYCKLVKAPFADKHVRLDCPDHAAGEAKKVFFAKKR